MVVSIVTHPETCAIRPSSMSRESRPTERGKACSMTEARSFGWRVELSVYRAITSKAIIGGRDISTMHIFVSYKSE